MKKQTNNINDMSSQDNVKEMGNSTSIPSPQKVEEMTQETAEKTAEFEENAPEIKVKTSEIATVSVDGGKEHVDNTDAHTDNTDAPTDNAEDQNMAEEKPADALTPPTKTVVEETVTEKLESAQEVQQPSSEALIRQAVNGSAVVAQEEKEGVTALLTDILSGMDKGQISEETLQQLVHAIHYDRDMAQAGHDGEVRGRNARIDEWLNQRHSAADIHNLGNTATPSRPSPPLSVIGGLTAADRTTIWERGHEKRVRH